MRPDLEWVDGDLWIRTYSVRYVPVTTINGESHPGYRIGPARIACEELKKLAPDADIGFAVERVVFHRFAPLCSWCASRPSTVEIDCDGLYWSGHCDSKQCTRTGDLRMGRKKL